MLLVHSLQDGPVWERKGRGHLAGFAEGEREMQKNKNVSFRNFLFAPASLSKRTPEKGGREWVS